MTAPLEFPAGTPLAGMTGDEQLAYWKHQARKHEQESDRLRRQLGIEPADLDAARQEGTAEGNASGARAYFRAILRLVHGHSAEHAADLASVIDASPLIGDDGLDFTKIDALAATIANHATTH